MATILTASQQQERFDYLVGTVLDNFSMTICLINYLEHYYAAKLPPPQATIIFRGQGAPAQIPGTNCGFFVFPVMTMAGVDCRRSLEFFGLRCSPKTKAIEAIQGRQPDDLGIEGFGLPMVTREQFLKATASMLTEPVEPVMAQVHHWTNKQLAHFTHVTDVIDMNPVRAACRVMIEAYMCLLFEALGQPRPKLNPSV